MAALTTRQPVALSAASRTFQTPTIAVGPQTAEVRVRLSRPADPTARVRVSLVVTVDGVEYSCEGRMSGGVRLHPTTGQPIDYALAYRPPVVMRDGAPLRIGQTGSSVTAHLVLERLAGTVVTDVLDASTREAPPPDFRPHNSVAFGAATSALENGGDGSVSVSHTSSGTDRAYFAGVDSFSGGSGTTSTSVTYGGTSGTELWDENPGAGSRSHAAYYNVGQATGAQTVVSTISDGSPQEHFLGVISMTGVDQTTPVGTPVTDAGASSPATVTVGSVGADDLVVDTLQVDFDGGDPTVGADQTERNAQDGTFIGQWFRQSTQPGTAGGVMSWTFSSITWLQGAVAFKPAAAAPSRKGLYRPGIPQGLAPCLMGAFR